MSSGFTEQSPYSQPFPQYYPHQILHGVDEEVDYLPGTRIRVWFTYLPTSYPIHRHEVMEIVEGVHSYYQITADNVTYTVEPGQLLIIPPGTLHDLTPGPECNGWIYLINLEWIRGIPTCARYEELLSKPRLLTRDTDRVIFQNMTDHLARMRSMYFSADENREVLFDAELLLMLAQLHTDLGAVPAEESPLDKRHAHGDLFAEVVTFIDHNYMKDLTLDGLARRFNLSSAYFSRLFTQYVHEPFSDYLLRCRMKEAERLLVNTSASVTEIALRCGYSTPSAFSRIFQAQRKCSPSQYRRSTVHTRRPARNADSA